MTKTTPTTMLTLSLSLAFAGAALPGCAPTAEDDDIAEIQQALDLEDGGYSTEGEAPAFGDAEVLATPELVTDFADPEDMTLTQASLPGMMRRRVLLMWGNLGAIDGGAPPGEPTDWSGQIAVDGGALGLVKTLVFDAHDGVLPRVSPDVIAFRSHTLPATDGLLVDVVAPASALLSFETEALSASISLGELDAKGRGVVMLGDGNNGLAYAGYEVHPDCAEGFLLGHWKNLGEGVGRFRGRVADEAVEPLGHVKGIYGYSDRLDEQVFFGKYIDVDGAFRGLLGGTYGEGAFQGRWKTIAPADHGTLAGRYFDGPSKDDGKGIFLGRWAEACGAE